MNQVSNYNFQVTSQKRDLDINHLEDKFTIVASEESINAMSFYFSLKLNKTTKSFYVSGIDLTPNMEPYLQVANVRSYIQGIFNFKNEDIITKALYELKNAFNDKECRLDPFSSSWRIFHRQFVAWFKSEFSIFLDNEIASHDLLLSLKKSASYE